MSTLQYRGRAPDSDYTVVHKKYIDDRYAVLKVDTAFINQAVATQMVNGVNSGYVDQQDGFLAHKAAVDTADAGYLATTVLGAANGVASLGSDIYVPPAQLPTLQTERAPFFKNADTLFLTGTATREVTTANPREFQLATLTIPDLGFPYTPLLFGVVRGGSLNGINTSRAMGTGNYAQISILRSDNAKYGFQLTSGQKGYDTFTCIPSSDPTAPISGANTFGLWVGMQSGNTYTFSAVGLAFYAIAMPGL